jgi:hypothetical protein
MSLKNHNPLYCDKYDYINQKEYNLLAQDEKNYYKKLAIININSDK